MTSKIITAVAAAIGVSLAGGACSTAAASSRTAGAGHARTTGLAERAELFAKPGGAARRRPATGPPADARRTFGSGCRILSRGRRGGEAALAGAPVAAALSRAPELSELAHAIQRAGLTRMLNAARALTVFAPDNAAFHVLGAGNLGELLATRADLVRVLKFHLVAGRVTPVELRKRRVFTTTGGTKLYLAPSGHSVRVNNATVTCGNVKASNATVYIVNRMIIPGS